mmetsp:Transcript_3120/g.7366  ORF Transcript_3120/g.7366 Transcript_3120/m.7366 type:complete len:81 (-) Transcript_3120:1058-1300(-)
MHMALQRDSSQAELKQSPSLQPPCVIEPQKGHLCAMRPHPGAAMMASVAVNNRAQWSLKTKRYISWQVRDGMRLRYDMKI